MGKKIQVTSASMPPFDEYCEEIKELWVSHWLTHTGIKHQELESRLKKYLDIPCVELFSNGHMALELALDLLVPEGEVITTPFTFASTTQAIIRSGLTPVFCDIEDKYYTIDANKIEALITDKTRAILPVHVYGNICDYKRIEKIAKEHDLLVIYDAAHAFGESIYGKNTSSLGDISMYSFHATKVFNTIEGGCLTFSDTSLEKEFRAKRQFGMYGKEDAEMAGTNAKMTEFQAAMGICNLRHIDEYIDKRRECVECYRALLENVPGITVCPEQENVKSNYAYFPILVDEKAFGLSRDMLCEKLAQNNIFARKYFYPLTSDFAVCREMFEINETPVAKRVSDSVLTLPLYSDLSVKDVENIVNIIKM